MSLPKYLDQKETGIEALASIPGNWVVKPVKAIARVINGYPFDSKLFNSESGHPLVRIRDLNKEQVETRYSGSFLHEAAIGNQDVLIGMDGDFNVGRWLGETPALLNQRMCCIRADKANTTRYLEYALPAPLKRINDVTYATTVKHLSSFEVLKIKVALPDSDKEVGQLVDFLDRETAKIDALIAEQQRLIELLQEKRQAVISNAVTKGLNPNAPMKDSGVEWLGEVPEHWEVLPCRAFLNERDERNGDYRSDYYLSLVAGRGVIPYEEKGDIGNKKPEDLGKCKLVMEGDFVINSMNYGIGSYGVSRFNGVCSPVYILTTPIQEKALNGFSFRVLENKWFQQYAQSFGNGILAHRCAISWDILKNINAGIPPKDEQAKILNYLDELTGRYQSLIAQLARQVTVLQERRSALISAAVTGQIDVRGLVPEEEP